MPYQFELDRANRILRCRFDGRVTDAILKEYYVLIPKYFALANPRAGITDFSDVTDFAVSAETIWTLANSAPAAPDAGRPRVIVAPAPTTFGMCRMFQIEGGQARPNLHVFRTPEEAFALLEVRDPHFEPISAD